MRIYPARAPRTHHSSHRGNFTDSHFFFFHCTIIYSSILMHAFIHSFIHSSHTSKHCICNCCITMLRITSQSGSRLIQYERRPTEVRRPAHEGLKATSHQTEPGEKNIDEPQQACPTLLRSGHGHLDLSHSILTSSQAHRISIEERPAGHLSRSEVTRASAERWVKEQWNAT